MSTSLTRNPEIDTERAAHLMGNVPLMVRIGNGTFRIRNYLFPIAFLLIFLPGPRIIGDGMYAVLLGLIVAVCGQLVRIATIGLTYIIRGGRDKRVYAEDLVTEGIYAHSRNPMYLGNMLIIAGVALTANTWTCLISAVAIFGFLYYAITRAEEDYLRRRFGGGYDRYCADVPRFVPRPRGLWTSLVDSTFHWRRVLVREYGTLVGWPIRWMLVVVWALWRDGDLAAVTSWFPVLGGALLLLLGFYLTIRLLKKRRLLCAD